MNEQVTVLEQLVEEAAQAQAELDRQALTQAVAATGPALRQRLQEEKWIQETLPTIEADKERVKALLDQARPQMQTWQEEFISATQTLYRLVEELLRIQEIIDKAADLTRKIARTELKVSKLQGSQESPSVVYYDGMAELWRQTGGTDQSLNPLPDNADLRFTRWMPLIKVIANRSINVYHPASSIKAYFKV